MRLRHGVFSALTLLLAFVALAACTPPNIYPQDAASGPNSTTPAAQAVHGQAMTGQNQ